MSCFAVTFRKIVPDHRGKEQKAVLQIHLGLFAQIESRGQNSGPEVSESSKVLQTACSASFLTPPLGDPWLSITEEGPGQAAGQGVTKVL